MGHIQPINPAGRQIATRLQATQAAQQALLSMQRSAIWHMTDTAEARASLTPAIVSSLETARIAACGRLEPSTVAEFSMLMAVVLDLNAPMGMGKPEKTAWLKAARLTLCDIPPDLLALGCQAARETVDHPAKVVPAVMKAIQSHMATRKADLARVEKLMAISTGEREPHPWEIAPWVGKACTPEEAAAIRAEFGFAGPADARRAPRAGQPQKPTPQDYAEMGVKTDEIGEGPRLTAPDLDDW